MSGQKIASRDAVLVCGISQFGREGEGIVVEARSGSNHRFTHPEQASMRGATIIDSPLSVGACPRLLVDHKRPLRDARCGIRRIWRSRSSGARGRFRWGSPPPSPLSGPAHSGVRRARDRRRAHITRRDRHVDARGAPRPKQWGGHQNLDRALAASLETPDRLGFPEAKTIVTT